MYILRLFLFPVYVIGGVFISHKLKVPNRSKKWIILILLVLVADVVGISTRLFSIFEFTIILSEALFGLGIGVLLGFIIKKFRGDINV